MDRDSQTLNYNTFNDTPIVGGRTALVGSPMGDREVGSGIPMTPLRGSSSQEVEPKKPPVDCDSTADDQWPTGVPDRLPCYPSTGTPVCGAYKDKATNSHILDGTAGCRH